jgi:hypothetical protein
MAEHRTTGGRLERSAVMQTAAPEIDPTSRRSTLTPNLTPSGARNASVRPATAIPALCVADQGTWGVLRTPSGRAEP